MRVAIPVWNDRVSPVFDVSRSLRVFDIHDGAVVSASNRRLKGESRALALLKLGVDLVICAAISTSLESTLWVSGIEVLPGICGSAEEIVEAFAGGDRTLAEFRSPGNARKQRPKSKTSFRHRSKTRVVR
jgi:predicted Fe-Mo cluster-binding NifX family protein